MQELNLREVTLNRRRILSITGGLIAGGLVTARNLRADRDSDNCDGDSDDRPTSQQQSIADQIESIIGAQGTFDNGVFSIEIDRNDIDNVTLHGVPILPSFEINGTLYFQFLCNGEVMMNSDLALKPSEIDAFSRCPDC